MAKICRRKPVQKSLARTSKLKSTKSKTKRRKCRKRPATPLVRPKYGCGRLHWNMRNHGKIDVRRKKRKTSAKAAMKIAAKENIRKSAMLEYSEKEPALANGLGKDNSVTATSNMAEQTADCKTVTNESQLTSPDSNQVDAKTETDDKQVSAHLIYDDDDEEESDRVVVDAEDSLLDVATVPEHETNTDPESTPGLPPAVPWNKDGNFNNSNNKNVAELLRRISPSSAVILMQEYVKDGKRREMPNRKCAVYARVRINQIYNPRPNRRKSYKTIKS